MKGILISILLITIHLLSFSQTNDTLKTLNFTSINVQYNILDFLPHHDTLVPLKKGYFHNLEIDAVFTTTGNKQWHKLYNYPQQGLSLNIFNFGNNKVLGNGIGIYPFLAINLINKNKIYANIRIGSGMAYITKKYNPKTNPTNIAISTSFNALIDLRLNIGFYIFKRLELQSSIIATHISNGAFKKPNYGLNSVGIGLGINYKLCTQYNNYQAVNNPITHKTYYTLSFLGSIKETGNAGGPKYFPLSLQNTVMKSINTVFELGGNLDIMYDKSVRFHLYKNEMNYSSPKDDFSIGLSAKVKFPLDKFSIFGDMGLYIYQPNPEFPITYQRIGFNYSISKQFDIITALKTHFTTADHIDFGLAIKL